MNKDKLKHMITRKSTWVVIISQIGLILNTTGVFDNLMMDKYRIISSACLVIIEALGLVNIYQTEPLPDNSNEN